MGDAPASQRAPASDGPARTSVETSSMPGAEASSSQTLMVASRDPVKTRKGPLPTVATARTCARRRALARAPRARAIEPQPVRAAYVLGVTLEHRPQLERREVGVLHVETFVEAAARSLSGLACGRRGPWVKRAIPLAAVPTRACCARCARRCASVQARERERARAPLATEHKRPQRLVPTASVGLARSMHRNARKVLLHSWRRCSASTLGGGARAGARDQASSSHAQQSGAPAPRPFRACSRLRELAVQRSA